MEEDSHAEKGAALSEGSDRKLLNIHEAGHAAIAAHFKMDVVRVYVSKTNTSLTELKKVRHLWKHFAKG